MGVSKPGDADGRCGSEEGGDETSTLPAGRSSGQHRHRRADHDGGEERGGHHASGMVEAVHLAARWQMVVSCKSVV